MTKGLSTLHTRSSCESRDREEMTYLKVIRFPFGRLVEGFLEDDQRVPNEQMRKVCGQGFVHACIEIPVSDVT